MTCSETISESTTFTVTHARHLATKVATDLKRIQRFYGQPSDDEITKYEEEMTQLLRNGYLREATYGFRRNNSFVEPTVRYTARQLTGEQANDDDPGRVRPNANITGATFYSYVTYSATWDRLTIAQREGFKAGLPIKRSGAPEPSVSGYLQSDLTYSAGGRAIDRQSVRSV